MAIPDFRDDGYLPMGVHKATESEVDSRFGHASRTRMALMGQLSRWLAISRAVHAERFLLNGSFATTKVDPNDVDCAVWLPRDFMQQFEWGKREAVELYQTIASGSPAELMPVFSHEDWEYWVGIFSRIRDNEGTYKGIVEVIL